MRRKTRIGPSWLMGLLVLLSLLLAACGGQTSGGSGGGGGGGGGSGGGGGGGGAGSTPVYATRPDGVYRDGVRIPLYGVNWFGLETCDRAPHGLWSGRSVADFLAQVKGWGFTALRVPVSPQVLRDEGTGRTGLR